MLFPKNIKNDYLEKLGFPGNIHIPGCSFQFIRGKLWTMRQFAGFGTPEETNIRFKSLMKNGQTVYLLPMICQHLWDMTPIISFPKER